MSHDLVPSRALLTDDDIAALESAAAWLREEVVTLELEVALLDAELRDFRQHRACVLSRLYARLDALDAAIAVELLARRPADAVLQHRASEASARAQQSATYTASLHDPPPPRPPACQRLRRAYHAAARRMHPDLGEELQRPRRHRFMVQLNEAYERRDEQAIADLVDDWEAETVCVRVTDRGERLDRARRMLAQLQRSQERLTQRLTELRASPEHRSLRALREDGPEGWARFDRLLTDLEARIVSAEQRLVALRSRPGEEA